MKTGNVYLYKNKPVFVTDYRYDVNGRISNWVSFRYINKNGFLGKSGGDYLGNQFKPVKFKIKFFLK